MWGIARFVLLLQAFSTPSPSEEADELLRLLAAAEFRDRSPSPAPDSGHAPADDQREGIGGSGGDLYGGLLLGATT